MNKRIQILNLVMMMLVLFVGNLYSQQITPPPVSNSGGTCLGLAGDVTGTCAANTVVKVNGGSVPVSAVIVGTNGSSQPVAATTTGTGTTAVLSVSPVFTGAPAAPTASANDISTTIANTAFVRAQIAALTPGESVQAATVTTLPANTYNNGTAGVGATLTGNANGALAAIDGYTAVAGDRLLINNQAAALQNGVYSVTTVGDGGTPYVLTRATDYNTVSEINGAGAVPVLNGTVNNNTLWVLNNSITTIGTTAINYSLGATSAFPALQIRNASSTGTALNKLAKLTGAPSTVVVTATNDTNGAIGVCSLNCGTTGTATIVATPGQIYSCIFSNATTAGHWVIISNTVAGDCKDSGVAGTASPAGLGEVVGRVMTTNAAGGTFSVLWGSLDTTLAAGTQTIASGTSAMGTGAISSAACATVVSTSATGVLTTDNIMADFNADPTGVTGYIPSTSGMLTIIKYPTADHVNFKVCNNTGSSITPGAITLNWRVVR